MSSVNMQLRVFPSRRQCAELSVPAQRFMRGTPPINITVLDAMILYPFNHQRRTATAVQIASTKPNGHDP
jgi:hypothetical protein